MKSSSKSFNSKNAEQRRRLRESIESDDDNISKRSGSSGIRIGFKGKRPILEILDDDTKSELEENSSKDSPPPSAKFRRIKTLSSPGNKQKPSPKRSKLASSSSTKLRRSPRLRQKRLKLVL